MNKLKPWFDLSEEAGIICLEDHVRVLFSLVENTSKIDMVSL
ncbi:MAG: hypothetical protein OQJ89_13125 [Kangiellaceae bacterium]|nr:hypothetical protein [Kangiellaceae bacterium]